MDRDPTDTRDDAGADVWRVCAYALCRSGGDLLVVRASALTDIAGRWFLPGGGLAFGEEPAAGVLRELAEETGLTGSAPRLLDVLTDVRERRHGGTVCTIRIVYEIDEVRGTLRHEAHGTTDEARWVPLDELGRLDVAPYVLRAVELSEEK